MIVRPGEDGLLTVSNDDLGRGEDLTVAHHVPRERRPVRLAQHDVKVARLARECSNQRADLEMFLVGDNLQSNASSVVSAQLTLLFPSAGVWLARRRVALVREPQHVMMKAASSLFSLT